MGNKTTINIKPYTKTIVKISKQPVLVNGLMSKLLKQLT